MERGAAPAGSASSAGHRDASEAPSVPNTRDCRCGRLDEARTNGGENPPGSGRAEALRPDPEERSEVKKSPRWSAERRGSLRKRTRHASEACAGPRKARRGREPRRLSALRSPRIARARPGSARPAGSASLQRDSDGLSLAGSRAYAVTEPEARSWSLASTFSSSWWSCSSC